MAEIVTHHTEGISTNLYTHAHNDADSMAMATWSGIWQQDITHAVTSDNIAHMSQLHRQRQEVEAVIARAMNIEFSGHTPHIAAYMDRFFHSVLAHNHYNGNSNYADLAYLGINPTGLESVWHKLVPVAQRYATLRPSPVDNTSLANLITQRQQTASAVLSQVNRDTAHFFGHHERQKPQFIAAAYRALQLTSGDQRRLNEERHITQELLRQADNTLAEALGVQVEQVPFSYTWLISQSVEGLVFPQFESLVEFNRHAIQGDQIHLNCCPNYATEQKNGKHVYTFEGLGTGIGLTAERGFPLVMAMIQRVKDMQQQGSHQKPLNIRIGVADFEAIEANAKSVGLTVDGFRQHLGTSVESMIAELQKFADRSHMQASINRTNSKRFAIGEWQMYIGNAAHISLGAISESYRGVHAYNGEETFQQLVAPKRDMLEERARSDSRFQEQLNGILGVRMGIMLRWSDGTETPLVRQLCQMFDGLTATNFSRLVPPPNQVITGNEQQPGFAELRESLNAIVRTQASTEEKSAAAKRAILRWLKEGSNRHEDQRRETLTFLQVKVARQGAEDAVMSELHAQLGGAQIVADSSIMWEVFGNEAIPRIVVRGNYEGADK